MVTANDDYDDDVAVETKEPTLSPSERPTASPSVIVTADDDDGYGYSVAETQSPSVAPSVIVTADDDDDEYGDDDGATSGVDDAVQIDDGRVKVRVRVGVRQIVRLWIRIRIRVRVRVR
jgi:hypothetical protein